MSDPPVPNSPALTTFFVSRLEPEDVKREILKSLKDCADIWGLPVFSRMIEGGEEWIAVVAFHNGPLVRASFNATIRLRAAKWFRGNQNLMWCTEDATGDIVASVQVAQHHFAKDGTDTARYDWEIGGPHCAGQKSVSANGNAPSERQAVLEATAVLEQRGFKVAKS